MRKLRVGVSVEIKDKNDSFWVNGIKQNAVTLQKLFSLCPNVENSYLVDFGKLQDYKGTSWESFGNSVITYEQSLDMIDILVTVTVTPNKQMFEEYKKRNIVSIKHTMGNEYLAFSQMMLFDDAANFNSFNKRRNYKQVWISPHLYEQNKDFMEVVCECPAKIGPYVWNPEFLEQQVNLLKKQDINVDYAPRGEKGKIISVFEPNLNLEKTSLTPTIILEKMFMKEPDLIKLSHIFGTNKIKQRKSFIEYAADLNIYRNKKMFFEARLPIAVALYKYTDIVLCHQRDLALNYLYFDAAWMGYPVVHNAHFVKDLGFYYEGWDADSAADHLIMLANTFDNDEQFRKDYRENSKKVISRYLYDQENNINGYAELLESAI